VSTQLCPGLPQIDQFLHAEFRDREVTPDSVSHNFGPQRRRVLRFVLGTSCRHNASFLAPPASSPYRGEYVIIRVDDAAQGREVVRRMIAHVAKADATIDMHAFTSGYSLKSSSGFAGQYSVPWQRFSSDAWGRSCGPRSVISLKRSH
jgi:hypothetical protein